MTEAKDKKTGIGPKDIEAAALALKPKKKPRTTPPADGHRSLGKTHT